MRGFPMNSSIALDGVDYREITFAEPIQNLEATSFQKGCTLAGWYAAWALRELIGLGFRCTRYLPSDNWGTELADRAQRVALYPLTIPSIAYFGMGGSVGTFIGVTGLGLTLPALALYAVASCAGKGRFELIGFDNQVAAVDRSQLRITTWNLALQKPWSDWTAGVEPPDEIVVNQSTRVDEWMRLNIQDGIDIFAGQEFEDRGAVDRAVQLAQEKGYKCIRDLGADSLLNHSGLFLMIKNDIQVENICFTPFPYELNGEQLRTGLAAGSRQGVLQMTVMLNGKKVTFFNTHLNYGGSTISQASRDKEMRLFIQPLMKQAALRGEEPILVGDVNFNTAEHPLSNYGLGAYTNELSGVHTCSDMGKYIFRGKPADTESDDAVIYNPDRLKVEALPGYEQIYQLEKASNGTLLSDHTRNSFILSWQPPQQV